MRIFMVTLVFVIVVMSCTNRKSSGDELKSVTLTKIYTIEGFPDDAEPKREFSLGYIFKADNGGFCYIADEKSGSIKVFDRSGGFYSSISQLGMGPEEIENLNTFYFHKDTVFVIDNRAKLKKFLRNGQYIGFKTMEPEILTLIRNMFVLNDSTFLCSHQTFERTSDNIRVSHKLSFFDQDMRLRTDIYEKSHLRSEFDEMVFIEPVFTVSEKGIFVSQRSKTAQNINIYSHEGQFLRNISKNIPRIKFSKSEMTKIYEFYKDQFEDESEIDKWYDYKFCLSELFSDKYGNLWVQNDLVNALGKTSFDIYGGDKIIAKFDYDNEGNMTGEIEFFIKDRFYVIDYANNEIVVYDYKIN
jgi:hypothetical protein